MSPVATRKSTGDGAQYIAAKAVLGSLAATLKALQGKYSVNESALRKELTDLPERLEEVKEDLEDRHRFCRDLCTRLESQRGCTEFFEELNRNAEMLEATRKKLVEMRRRVAQTEEIVEGLYRVTASRNVLERVRDAEGRKDMAKSLTKSSIILEKVFQLGKELEKSLNGLAAKGVHEKLGTDGAFAPHAKPAASKRPKTSGHRKALSVGLRQDLRQTSQKETPAPAPEAASGDRARKRLRRKPDREHKETVAHSASAVEVAPALARATHADTSAVKEPPPAPAQSDVATRDSTTTAERTITSSTRRFRRPPRTWTWKTSAGVALMALAGVPVGYFVARLLWILLLT